MLSSVLRSKQAVQVNIEIMRAFVRLRHLLSTSRVFAQKFEDLERKYDAQFKVVFDELRKLMDRSGGTKPIGVGFKPKSTR
jgi:hypothetical protein